MTQKQEAAEQKRIKDGVHEIAGHMYAEGTLTVMPFGDQPVLLAALEQRGITGISNTRLGSMIGAGAGKVPSPYHVVTDMLNADNTGKLAWTDSFLRSYVVEHKSLHGIARKDFNLLYREIVKIEESKTIEEGASPVESIPVDIMPEGVFSGRPILTNEKLEAFGVIDDLLKGASVVMSDHAEWERYAHDLEEMVEQQADEIHSSKAATTAEVQKRKALQRKLQDMKEGRSGVIRLPLSGMNLLRLLGRHDVEYIAGEIPGLGQTVVIEWVDNVE